MKKWRVRLRDQRRTIFPLVIAVTLAYLLILRGIVEFLRLSPIASGVKGALQDAVIVVVNNNYANVCHRVRGGYLGGYYTEEYDFEEAVDTENIYHRLDETLGTWREGGNRVKYTGGVPEYKTIGLDVEIRSAPLISFDLANAQRFEADTAVWLEVPVRFAGKTFPSMRTELKVQAGYIEVFRKIGEKEGEMREVAGPLGRATACYVVQR